MENVKADIGKMSNDQLNEIANAVNMRRKRIQKQAIRSMLVGNIVSFETRKGTITGRVRKINRKNVVVQESNTDTRWNVPANLLTKLKIGE
tara:strand:+ start:226 stop:498 length:273 start_codon:yes stop_codon:yes gene_type:complete